MASYDLTSGKTGRTYKVEFDNDPTPEDVDFAIDYFDNQPVAEEQPGLGSQLLTSLGIGTRSALASGRTAFNVLTGDTEDTATALADLAAAQREAQAAQTPEDVAFLTDLQQQAAELEAAEGILPTLREAVDLPLAALRQPGAALKTAVQSLPNVLVSTPVTIGAGLAGAAAGGLVGLPTTGPGALVTGALGAAAGGALANTALEVGPAVFDILNERTDGAAANWTREQILEALKADPTIVEEGLKRGATRGAVIGATEAIGLGAGSRLAGASGRAVQQATRRALVEQGVDLADDVAVRAGMQLPAVQAAREAAQAGFTRAGEVARVAGGAGIETAASGAGEALAQLATGEDVDTADVFLEMLGESVASVPTVLAGQVLGRDPVVRATAANVQRAEEVMGEAFPNVDELEAQVGREAADAVAQAVVDAGVPPTVEGEFPIEVNPPAAETPVVAEAPQPVSEPTPIAPVEPLPAVEAEAPAAVETQTQPEPQATQDEIQIAETSGLPPVEGQPVVQAPAVEAQAGTPLGSSQGQEGQVTPEPVQPTEVAPAVSELPAPQAEVVSQEAIAPTQPLPPTGGVPTESLPAGQPTSGDVGTALRAVATNTATPEQVASLEAQGLARTVQGQPVITDAGLAQMPEAERPGLSEAERVAEIEGQGSIMASTGLRVQDMFAVPPTPGQTPGLLERGVTYIEPPGSREAVRIYQGLRPQVSFAEMQSIDRLTRKGMSPALAAQVENDETSLHSAIREEISDLISSGAMESGPQASEYYEREFSARYRAILQGYADLRLPLLAEDVDSDRRGITLPEGYVREGDLFVFRPEGGGAAPTNTPPANVQPSIRPLQGDQQRNETLARRKRPKAQANALRSRDGEPLPNITVTPANAAKARDKESRQVPGASETWIGTTEQFLAEFADTDAGRAVEGNAAIEAFYDSATDRAVVLTDRVQVREGDARRAVRNGTSAAEEAVRRLIRHESFVHRGWRALPSDLRSQFLAISDSVVTADDLDTLAKTYRRYANWRNDPSLKALVFEEWLAQRIERIEKLPAAADGPLAQVREWLGRVWQWLTGDDSLEATPTELRDVIRLMVRALETGEKPVTEVEQPTVLPSLTQDPNADTLRRIVSEATPTEAMETSKAREFTMRANTLEEDEKAFMDAPSANLDYYTQSVENAKQGAIKFVDAMGPVGEWGQKLLSPEWREATGLKTDSYLYPFVLAEALNRSGGIVDPRTTEGVARVRSNEIIAGLFSGIRTSSGQSLNAMAKIMADPRYAPMFVQQAARDMTNKTAATVVDPQTNVPAATDAVRQGDEQARQQATDDLAEELRLRDLIYDMGIAAQDAGIAERIRRINDNVFRLGVIERMRAAMAASGVAPSFVSASRAAVEQQYEGFTLEQLEAEAGRLRDEIRQDVAAVEQAAKATPRKGRKGSDPASQAKVLIDKLEASPQVPKKPKPNPVRDIYREHLKEPMAAEDFIGALTAMGVDIADAQKLYDLAAIKIAALETAKANRPSQKEKLSEAERFAERVINDAAEQFADPALPVEEKQRKTLPIRDLFNFHVQNGMTLEAFIPAAAQAGLDEATARRLHGAGLLVREARQSAKAARTEQKLDEMAAKEAGRLIYETSKLHRQSGYINATSPEADTIRKAFMDQVKEPMPFEQFADRLKPLRVEEDLATRLFNVADREHAARKAVALERERQAEFKRLSDRADRLLDPEKNALASALNNIRSKTEGAPTWAQLFNQPFETQRQWRQRFYEALRADPALANLTPQETRDLAAALDKVWNDKRERNLQSILKRANLPGTKEKTKQKIAESVPLLLRYLNTGVFNDDSFRAAVAKKFGAKVLTADDLAKISDLAQRAQKDGISTPERTKLLDEMIRTIQLGAGVELGEVISNVWVTSVLSGFRTQFEMALSSLNGLRGMAQTAADVAIRKRNFKMVGEAAKAYFKTMANTILESANYFVTGDPTLLDGYQYTATQFMNEGLLAANPFDFFEQVIKDPRVGPWGKITAYFFAGIQRAMRIWDHINSTSVKEGMIPLAMALDPERYKDARMPSKEDVAMAKEKAIAIAGGNKTWFQKRDVTSYTRQILNDLLNSRYPGIIDEARETGFTLAYQNDPTGLGGIVYHTLLGVTKKMVNAAGKFRDEGVAKREQSEWNEAAKVTDKAMRGLLYIGATNSRNMFGFRFVRFVGNRVNELISFTPLVGLARLAEKDMSATKRSMIYTNQVVGSMFGLWVISSMLRAMEDEEDPEKRGFDVEGSWANLTPQQKNQRRAEDKIPYSITIGGMSFNYNAWPMASLIATVGNLYDMKRYRPDKWNEKDVFDRLISAAWSGATSFTDISSLSGLMDLLGRSAYSTDPVEGAKQWAAKFSANYVGGFIPRALKDLDMVFDPEARKPDNLFGYFAKEIPFYRRTEAAGEKLYDIFGEPVQMRREPWSRSFAQDKLEAEYQLLGDLNERGIFLSPANPDNRTVGSGANRRELTKAEAEAYMMETGKLYKDYILRQGERLKELDFETAKEKVSRDTERLRNAALRRAISITN